MASANVHLSRLIPAPGMAPVYTSDRVLPRRPHRFGRLGLAPRSNISSLPDVLPGCGVAWRHWSPCLPGLAGLIGAPALRPVEKLGERLFGARTAKPSIPPIVGILDLRLNNLPYPSYPLTKGGGDTCVCQP